MATKEDASSTANPITPRLFPGIATLSDGGLRYTNYGGPHGYIDWETRHRRITLDGAYTVEELRLIIAHMEQHQAKR